MGRLLPPEDGVQLIRFVSGTLVNGKAGVPEGSPHSRRLALSGGAHVFVLQGSKQIRLPKNT